MNDFYIYKSSDYKSKDAITHHGILGQKWGVRRFQNPDGTLTEAGRERLVKNVGKMKGSKQFRASIFLAKETMTDNDKRLLKELSSSIDNLDKKKRAYYNTLERTAIEYEKSEGNAGRRKAITSMIKSIEKEVKDVMYENRAYLEKNGSFRDVPKAKMTRNDFEMFWKEKHADFFWKTLTFQEGGGSEHGLELYRDIVLTKDKQNATEKRDKFVASLKKTYDSLNNKNISFDNYYYGAIETDKVADKIYDERIKQILNKKFY